MVIPPGEEPQEVKGVDKSLIITWRDMPPSHYILKVKSLSSILDKTGLDKYESNEFSADENRWKLLLYYVRDQENEGSGHLSLYLKCLSPTELGLVNFFLYDQIKDKYLSIQETRVRQFTDRMEESGHSALVLLDFFRDASNGFVIKDCCVFGVEIFVIRTGRVEYFRTRSEQSGKAYVWKVQISELKETAGHFSPTIHIGNFNWKLHLYRNISKGKGDYLAICLCLQDHSKFPSGQKMHVRFRLSINDNKNPPQKVTKIGNAWFSASDAGWGFPYFIELDKAEKLKSGDVIEIELQIILISMEM